MTSATPSAASTSAQFEGLCQRVDAVYHLAADINLQSSYLDIRKVNTFGVRNVLEIWFAPALQAPVLRIHHGCVPRNTFAASRTSSRTTASTIRCSRTWQPMKKTFPLGLLGYPWSKLVSEQALRFAQQTGMPLGDSSVCRKPTCPVRVTARRMTSVFECLPPRPNARPLPAGFTFRISNEAVDTLSRVCAAISLNEKRRFTIYHCCNPELDRYDLEPGDFGFYWPHVDYDTFKRACQARGEDSTACTATGCARSFRQNIGSPRISRRIGCRSAIVPLREDCPLPIEWTSTLKQAQAFPSMGRSPSSGMAL